MQLERRDVPTVLVVEDIFETAARSLAKTLGLGDMPMVVVPQPKPGQTAEARADLVNRVVEESARGLMKSARQS